MKEKPPKWSKEALSIQTGSQYTHYKGFEYKVLAIARHSETLEELVVYQALYGDCEVWVRPLQMFVEKIVVNNKTVARFSLTKKGQ